ncbi:MAG: signal peptidase I [Opitutaceae bacterium]|nr:signal peptidase I [Opitutaceae bacterium]
MKSLIKNKNHKKLREQADNWLRLAEKVYHFRKDVISAEDIVELQETSLTLNTALKKKGHEDWGKVRLASEELEKVLKRVGGFFYPHNFWAENAEMFIVAAIVALAIRTFFLQPFKIPTNSMFPTYNGMTHEVYEAGDEPGWLGKVLTTIAWGSVRRQMVAPVDGEILIPAHAYPGYFDRVPGRKWLVLPTTVHEYSFLVGKEKASFKVPQEFSPNEVFKDAFFPDEEGDWNQMVARFRAQGRLIPDSRGYLFVRTGKTVMRGETALSFAIHTGDALFVDRMSYHFIRPDVGDAIVFKTEYIPATADNKYYIKRLVGEPGDELQVKAPKLYRNGELITGAKAFEKNANQEGDYSGYSFWDPYRKMRYLSRNEDFVTIPPDSFFAMGDNSPYSSDSRFWGFNPKKEMVGRAIFIYYPFTTRWGLAK